MNINITSKVVILLKKIVDLWPRELIKYDAKIPPIANAVKKLLELFIPVKFIIVSLKIKMRNPKRKVDKIFVEIKLKLLNLKNFFKFWFLKSIIILFRKLTYKLLKKNKEENDQNNRGRKKFLKAKIMIKQNKMDKIETKK